MKKYILAGLMFMSLLSLVGCGGDSNADSAAETEPLIKTKQEQLTSDSSETTALTTTAEETPTAPVDEPLNYESGIALATITINGTTFNIQSGDNLNDVMEQTGLQYISWSQTYADIDRLHFYGKGYALHDLMKDDDETPEDYSPSYVSFEVADGDGNLADSLKSDKSQYSLAGVYVSSFDNDNTEVIVMFGSVMLGMTEDEVIALYGEPTEESGANAMYIVDGLAILIDYDSHVVDRMYAVPATLLS